MRVGPARHEVAVLWQCGAGLQAAFGGRGVSPAVPSSGLRVGRGSGGFEHPETDPNSALASLVQRLQAAFAAVQTDPTPALVRFQRAFASTQSQRRRSRRQRRLRQWSLRRHRPERPMASRQCCRRPALPLMRYLPCANGIAKGEVLPLMPCKGTLFVVPSPPASRGLPARSVEALRGAATGCSSEQPWLPPHPISQRVFAECPSRVNRQSVRRNKHQAGPGGG